MHLGEGQQFVSQPRLSTKSQFIFGKFDLAQIAVGPPQYPLCRLFDRVIGRLPPTTVR